MKRDSECIFCKIIAREIPTSVVFEDDAMLSFLDVGPLADGHILCVPRDHYARLVELPAALCGRIAEVLPRLGRALLLVTGAEGFNVLINNGSAAGQVVDHVHWHLIPRVAGDSLGYRWNAGTYAAGAMDRVANAYRTALADTAP